MRADAGFEPLVTDRLHLRRSRPEDAEAISAYRSDPDVRRYQGWERTDPDGIRAQIEEMTARAPGQPGGWVQLSVEERESGRLVGDVGLSPADGEPGVIKVGYTIAPEFQGRGYATEAVAALVAYAIDTLGADVVRAYASAENVPSIKVAEKVGMRLVERFEHHSGGRDLVRRSLRAAPRLKPVYFRRSTARWSCALLIPERPSMPLSLASS
jgi:RimJ/RimL family protein N-acetyltransferase